MDDKQRFKSTVISTIIRDVPKAFWSDARARTRQTYLDAFHNVQNDPNIIPEQKIDKLYQDRHFLMENTFKQLSDNHGLIFTPTLINDNSRCYGYSVIGSIGMTQAYIPAIGKMPKPATYRKRHASINSILASPRLDLGDEPRQAIIEKDFYGILSHNPCGRKFNEENQRLGMLQFCIPANDCTEWIAEFTIEEILSAYPVTQINKEADRKPSWKKTDKRKGGKK